MNLEQRGGVIRMAADGNEWAKSHPSLSRKFGNRAFKKTGCSGGLREEDPKEAPRSGRSRDDVTDDALRRTIDDDTALSCNAREDMLNIAAAAVWR